MTVKQSIGLNKDIQAAYIKLALDKTLQFLWIWSPYNGKNKTLSEIVNFNINYFSMISDWVSINAKWK